MSRLFFGVFALFLFGHPVLNAQKNIQLEDIWSYYSFFPNYVPGFNFLNDGRHYSSLDRNKIVQFDFTTGQPVKVLFDANTVNNEDFKGYVEAYTFSADEQKILVESEVEPIYRRSSKANFFVYDSQQQSFEPLFDKGKQLYATFSPDGVNVAFVFENNLYVKNLKEGKLTQITEDGAFNQIINGALDWVYEEEFGFARGFEWSPDGRYIAFYRFDESMVKEFTMTHFNQNLYPDYETFKYPKVGEKNAEVSIKIYDIQTGALTNVDVGEEKDQYIPRIKWTNNTGNLCVYRLNRHQNNLDLLLANSETGKTKLLYNETNKYYIGEYVFDNIRFLKDGKHFLWTSEQDGWHHIYLYDMQGQLVRQLTKGNWEVTTLYGVDEANGLVYYQAAEKSPMERQIYAIGLNGSNKREIAGEKGWNDAQFSSTYDFYSLTHSTFNAPPEYTVFDRNGKMIRVLADNAGLVEKQKEYQVSPGEFFTFNTSENVKLNGWMIKPRNFDENRKYPVLMFVYGGPGSQQVVDSWGGQNYWWYQMLAEQGFVVACVDNRGTGGRGEEFKKMTYLQLGKYETIDQIETAKYVGKLPFVDASNIGIFGWSYGGYMSSLAILKGNDVFKAAIAVAPVTNWKWYDSVYTERYMRTEAENSEGYEDNSPVNFADQLKGSYLLVHGMGDDNVHFQQTAEMANALISANKQFDTYFYPNRDHGIYGGNARLHLYTKMTNFLNQNLNTKKIESAPRAEQKTTRPDVAPSEKQLTPGSIKKKNKKA